MICRSCRTLHTGAPKDCPHGCACQHKPRLLLVKPPRPAPVILGFECRACGVVVKDEAEECACPIEYDNMTRIPVHDTEL